MTYVDDRREMQKSLREKEDVQTGIRITLLDMLYDRKITIEEFKDYCTNNGLDYNEIEHCCGCAGCYDPEEGSPCPDFEYENCKIRKFKLCNICGLKASMGYLLTDENNKEVLTFWTCKKHSNDPKLEYALSKGTSIESIIKEWNR
jgi:hypothetical protein